MKTKIKMQLISWGMLSVLTLSVQTLSPSAHAWQGDTWGTETRSTMESLANLMMYSTWTPNATISNFGYGTTYHSYYKGTTYTGMAYSQNNPQENWAEFLSGVTSTSGGSTGYGNDCSGFVSIAWKLPSRYTTYTFEVDATNTGGYVSSLGALGSGYNADLQLGDALNSSSNHIIMFKSRTAGGLIAMEQTPWFARSREWSWSQLSNYRPIRRNSITVETPPAPITGTVKTSGSNLNVRSGPSTSYSVVDTVANGATITIVCQVEGQTITGTMRTTSLWDRIGTSKYISHAYVDMGSNAVSIPLCQ